MDQFTAHLDRGWDLAQRGDAHGAESSARRALEIESDSPEAHNLLGFSCALQGDHEEAMEYYQQAIALDDGFLEPLLNAAELCIHPLADPEAALDFCAAALALVETEDEKIDAMLLQFDALLGLGRDDEAGAVIARLPAAPYENPMHSFLVGRALFEVGHPKKAEELLLDALKKDPENPEAQYYLGMLRDERGDAKASTEAFIKSLELDARAPAMPWSLSREAFESTAMTALERVNPRLSSFLDKNEVYFADAPGVEIVVEGADPRAPVLLDSLEGTRAALRLFIYQRNIERICGGLDRIAETIVVTLEREIATAIFGELEAPDSEAGTLN